MNRKGIRQLHLENTDYPGERALCGYWGGKLTTDRSLVDCLFCRRLSQKKIVDTIVPAKVRSDIVKVKRVPALADQDSVYVQLGETLRKARKKHGLSQEEAGLLLGLSRSSMNMIERGTHRLLFADALVLSRALGFPLDGIEIKIKSQALERWMKERIQDDEQADGQDL